MKTWITALALLLSAAPLCQAADSDVYAITCGEGRGQSPEKAEVALVDNLTGNTVLYIGGKALGPGEFDLGSAEGAWLVTVYGKNGKLDRKYVFHEAQKEVQEFLLEKKKEKTLGSPLPCVFPDS